MKPLSLNMSKMKKVAGDDKTSTFQHDAGHKIVVAHAALPAIQRKQLQRIPIQKMAEGGTAQPSPTPVPVEVAQGSMRKAFNYAEGTDSAGDTPSLNLSAQDIDPNASLNLPQQPSLQDQSQQSQISSLQNLSALGEGQTPQQPQSQPQASVPQPQTPQNSQEIPADNLGSTEGAVGQGEKALKEKRDIDTQMSKAVVANDDTQARQDNLENFQKAQQFMQQHAQTVMDHLDQQDIDGNKYLKDLSTGGKLATGIGLALSTFGSAFTDQNPAMDFLNKQIDRNVEAQKMNMEKDNNLFRMNHELFGDQEVASNMTRVHMNDLMDAKLKQAAAKMGTQSAQQSYDAASSQLKLQNADLLQKSALRSAVLHSMRSGGAGIDPVDLGTAGFMTPEQAQKEQSSVDAQKTSISAVKDIFGQLNKQQSLSNRITSPLQSSSMIDALNSQLAQRILDSDVTKRLSPTAVEVELKPFHVNLRDDSNTREQKMQGVLNLIKSHTAGQTPITEKYAPKSLPSYDQPQYKTVNGVTYMRGPNGEAIRVK